jgi:hypothetical protein
MCLECGSRLALDYRRPPSWRLPAAVVAIVLLLAGAGVAFGLAKVTDDAGKTAAAPTTGKSVPSAAPGDTPPTASQPTSVPADTTAATTATDTSATTTTDTTSTTTTTTDTTTDTSTTTTPASTSGEWPAGRDAFTVVLASETSRSAAKAKLDEAQSAGISGAGILHSDDFASLRPGYWVVFDGQFDTRSAAQTQAEQDQGTFADAYPRYVSADRSKP